MARARRRRWRHRHHAGAINALSGLQKYEEVLARTWFQGSAMTQAELACGLSLHRLGEIREKLIRQFLGRTVD
jgi:hypothetical protein